jgi:opacity protein-like surface antigen
MKMLKLALLGGAALAVSAAGAQADDLEALKAEIEALNARVAQLEATPSVPAGYQLVTITRGDAMVIPGFEETDPGYGKKATIISVMPTADAPASTSIEWSGYARAAAVWRSEGGDGAGTPEDDWDVLARGQIKVVGRTDTAVGEVGARLELRNNFDGLPKSDTFFEEAWGWWQITPELTLGGGYTDPLGNINFGLDAACNCYYTDNFIFLDPGDTSQMRLTWASGPFSVAGAIEDGSDDSGGTLDSMGGSAQVRYDGDTISGEIAGTWRNKDHLPDDFWQIGAGAAFALGDMASISAGGAFGHTRGDAAIPAVLDTTTVPPTIITPVVPAVQGEDFWVASILASVNLSDTTHAEAGFGFKDNDDSADVTSALAGIYYDPVSQLTIGLEVEWADTDGNPDDYMQADLVTVFRF